MKYTLAQIKESLLSKTGSRALSNIANFYSIVQEVCHEMMAQVDLPSAIRKVPFWSPLIQNPNLYAVPNDFSFNGLIDVYDRNYNNIMPRVRVSSGHSDFMRRIANTSLINLESIDGVQFINIRDDEFKRSYVIDSCNDSSSGTWVALGDATNVRYDTKNPFGTGSASIAFNVPATSTTFGVTGSGFPSPVSAENMLYMTLYAFFPEYTDELKIRIGSDSGNYQEMTVTKDWQGNRLAPGWNILLVDLSTGVNTGAWDGTGDITYVYYGITDTITTEKNGYKINSVFVSEETLYDIRYYSESIIENKFGERIASCLPTSDSDVILLNNREKSLFTKQFSTISGIDTQTNEGIKQFNAYSRSLEKGYEDFAIDFPSERVITSNPY